MASLIRRRPSFLGRVDSWKLGPLGVAGVLVLVAACLVIGYPLLKVLLRLFIVDGSLDFSAFQKAASMPGVGEVLLNTLVVVVTSVVLAVAVASVFAWANERTDARIGKLADALPLVPLVMPAIAAAIGWTFLLSPTSGYINVFIRMVLGWFGINLETGPFDIFSWPGLILAYTAFLIPYAYLPIAAALRNIDPALEEASRTSGAGGWRTLRQITVRVIAPAVASSTVLVLIVAMTLFSIPVVIATRANIDVLSVRIVRLITAAFPPQIDVAVVLGALLVLIIVCASIVQNRLGRSARFATIGGRISHGNRVRLGVWRWPLRIAMMGFLVIASVLPLASVILVSLQELWRPEITALQLDSYREVFIENRLVSESLLRSIQLGIGAATVGMLLAVLLAIFARLSHEFFSRVTAGVAGLPGAVSHIVFAIGLILAFGPAPFWMANTASILFICYLVLYLPQMYFTSSSAVNQVGRDLLEASSISGARQGRTFRKVIFPLSARGIAGGWSLAFVLVLGDLTASAMLAGTGNSVVGFQILDLYENGSYPTLAALAVVITIVSGLILTVVRGAGSLADRSTRNK